MLEMGPRNGISAAAAASSNAELMTVHQPRNSLRVSSESKSSLLSVASGYQVPEVLDGSDHATGTAPGGQQGKPSKMEENERIIREFIAAWSRLDATELAGYFTEDGVYHNMPTAPVAGRENVEQLIRGFSASWTETIWDLRNVLCAGNLVIAERVDRTRAGEKSVDLPCVGVFELEDGKIKVWRDYFDFGTYQRGLS
jgi:limonene-1,2-epoxide hydrolase